ncbi:UDP-glucose 4-epimerase GalE [Yinghuangia sp. ASG 101]|uniref:UDP-glucose 4-epimerase GalE n=1 Tax=Yinghuangia sp. ASG 101 TaxID=2896848 RepID=UPI001E4B2797|nr:UDP-glucose 4-epimerase GalE [Yinghuangia sp. ASG 101]UGQ15640.1 UDP-glucose 4-epimerase GalE [Yinghuangia sp. ASG 101]
MRVMVTGGAGYIGSVTTAMLLAAGHEATVLDDLSTGHRDAVPDGARFVEADVRAAGDVLAREPFDAVLHFAARSVVADSVADPAAYWHANVGGTTALLDAVRAHRVPRFVFSSTAAVYGDPAEVPIAETSATQPTNPYGATKLAVDHMIGSHATAYGLAAVSLRYFNVAGAHGDFGERHARETHLVPLVLEVARGLREHIVVHGTDWDTPDGTCVRDYIHVADLARAHVLALDAATPGRHEVCNLGNGVGFSVRDVIETARRVTGREIPERQGPRRAGDPAVLVAAADRAAAFLGWRPEHRDLAGIIADAWAFHRADERTGPAAAVAGTAEAGPEGS